MRTFALLSAFLVASVSPGVVAAPKVNIFIYAPVQENAPLRVTGFQYEQGFVKLVLLNTSDNPIAKVAIAGVAIAPLGCAREPGKAVGVGGSLLALRIAPHERMVTGRGSGPGFDAGLLIFEAQHLGAASLQFQVGVVEVDFADGQRWRPHDELPQAPFDPSLVAADAGKCPDADAVTNALTVLVDPAVRFDANVDKVQYRDEDGEAMPRLAFGCSLEGSKAVCPD